LTTRHLIHLTAWNRWLTLRADCHGIKSWLTPCVLHTGFVQWQGMYSKIAADSRVKFTPPSKSLQALSGDDTIPSRLPWRLHFLEFPPISGMSHGWRLTQGAAYLVTWWYWAIYILSFKVIGSGCVHINKLAHLQFRLNTTQSSQDRRWSDWLYHIIISPDRGTLITYGCPFYSVAQWKHS
jgi:hypothetical protein